MVLKRKAKDRPVIFGPEPIFDNNKSWDENWKAYAEQYIKLHGYCPSWLRKYIDGKDVDDLQPPP